MTIWLYPSSGCKFVYYCTKSCVISSNISKEERDWNRQQYQRNRDLPPGSNVSRYPHYAGGMPPGFGPMYPPGEPPVFPRDRYSPGEWRERDYRREYDREFDRRHPSNSWDEYCTSVPGMKANQKNKLYLRRFYFILVCKSIWQICPSQTFYLCYSVL